MNTNDIQVFSNSQFGDIRIVMQDSNPLFCLADICQALGLSNSRKVKTRLDEGGVTSSYTPTASGDQEMTFINEPNLYRCIFQSRKKSASQFQNWVFDEVLPSIRKTGGYMVAKQEDTPEEIMARALVVAQSTLDRQQKRLAEANMTIERQEAQIAEQSKELQEAAPKVNYYDETLMSTNTMTMTQAANSIGMSVYSLTDKLLKAGIIFRQSGQIMLRVPFCQWELHKTRTNTYTRSNGEIGTSIYMVWTQRGIRFINALRDHDFNVSATMADLRKQKKQEQAQVVVATV